MSARRNQAVVPVIIASIIGGLLCALLVVRADAAETKPGWQQQWEKIVQGAKKEGQVTVYVHSTYAPVLASGAFEKTFPDVKLTVVSERGRKRLGAAF